MEAKDKDKVQITFSEEQYELLIRLFFLGTWLQEADLLPNQKNPKINELEQYLYENCKTHTVRRYASGNLFFDGEVEEELLQAIEKYDNATFWDMLVRKLAQRDMEEETGMEYYYLSEEKGEEYYQKYRDELKKNGIKNLRINWTEE